MVNVETGGVTNLPSAFSELPFMDWTGMKLKNRVKWIELVKQLRIAFTNTVFSYKESNL